MEYSKLEVYAKRMLELAAGKHEFGPKRLEAEKDRLVFSMYQLLRGSINKMTFGKSIHKLPGEVQQHSMIAIHQALVDWNPTIATFSTHVHWRIRAELATLQHAMFPERRKVKVKQPIQILELDRTYAGEDREGFTLLDMMVDESAEDDVEAEARRHMGLHCLERIFSHYVARQMAACCASYSALDKIADRRLKLMRDRDIYIRRHLQLQTFEEISADIGVTRERVRQIIEKISDGLNSAMPRLSDDKKTVIPATKAPPADIHPDWPAYAAEYHAHTGIDPRLVNRDVPLPAHVVEEPVTAVGTVTVEVIATSGMLVAPSDETVDRISGEPAPRHQMAFDLGGDATTKGTRTAPRRSAAAAAALALAVVALPAAAQTSKALPPSDASAVVIDGQVMQAAVRHRPARGALNAHPVSRVSVRDRFGPLQPNDRITTSQPAWGVRIAEYPTVDAAKAGWPGERRSWSWLRGLYPAYFAPDARVRTHGVAFGPLSQAQAEGLCHEAHRISKPCSTVRFGVFKAPTPSVKDGKAPTREVHA